MALYKCVIIIIIIIIKSAYKGRTEGQKEWTHITWQLFTFQKEMQMKMFDDLLNKAKVNKAKKVERNVIH